MRKLTHSKYSSNDRLLIVNIREKKLQSREITDCSFFQHTILFSAYIEIVEKYIRGEASSIELGNQYDISSSLLRRWIRMYNANIELKDYNPKQEVYMAEARRKTTKEERETIVEYCLNNNRDYKNTAAKFDVSYSQVYNWVKKYDACGLDGLTDKRGHHKSDDEVDELERLRRENLRLKRQLEEKDMVVELLKKVKEFERM